MAYVSLPELIQAARAGTALISFPTDTVPALASHPDQAHRIFEAKQRRTDKPLILMGGADEDLWPYVHGSNDEQQSWKTIAQTYWPGALTLVLPASDRIPTAMNPTDPTTLGIRVPDCAIARHILGQTGPLATTSVNHSGQPALIQPQDINRLFPDVLQLSPQSLEDLKHVIGHQFAEHTHDVSRKAVFKARDDINTTPSTVIQWINNDWKLVRTGRIPFDG